MKLGKKLGVVEDRRTLQFAPMITTDAPKPPATFHFDHAQTSFPMFANDQYGDCTCASQGHRIIAQQSNAQQKDLELTDQDVLAVYSAVTGFNPSDPNTDNGAYCLDVLNYMRNTGMGKEKDGSTHTIFAFTKLDHTNHDHVKLASFLFGGLYVGAGLPVSAQSQVGSRWAVVNDTSGKFGSWGGHAMSTVGYDNSGPIFVTWGALQHASWAWWDKYVDECYAVISEDWIKSTGKTRSGFDVAQLQKQLSVLR